MKLLKQLFKVFSPSGHEGPMIHFLWQWITENVPEAIIELDEEHCNLYITKGKASTYPCCVAHLDQVQKKHSSDFKAIETRDIIFGWSPKRKVYEGLGADDKVGIWICLRCLQKYDNIKIAFFSQEETGCVGSANARLQFFENCRFVIQPDRRGSDDLITSIMGDLCSEEFLEAIDYERFGYKPTDGLTTDVGTLKDNGLGISCINLSCGYYDPHTDREYIVKKDVKKCLKFIQHIIETCTDVYPHESETNYGTYFRGTFAYHDEYDEMYDIMMDQLSVDPTVTADDMYKFYHNEYPLLSKKDFIEIKKDLEKCAFMCDEDEDPDWVFSPAI